MKIERLIKSNNGHRKRLKERFLKSGFDGFLDYEIIELLLTLSTPRKDCKQMAKEAIFKFKNLNGVFNASLEELIEVNGIGESNSISIRLFTELNKFVAKEKISKSILLDSPQLIFEYLRERIGREKKEHFVIIFFDTRNNLIIEDVSIGTLNASLIHPREVFKKAILNNTSHVVLAHNHPSGDPSPSDEDIKTTSRLIEAGKILGIFIIYHIIVTENKFISFKEKGFV